MKKLLLVAIGLFYWECTFAQHLNHSFDKSSTTDSIITQKRNNSKGKLAKYKLLYLPALNLMDDDKHGFTTSLGLQIYAVKKNRIRSSDESALGVRFGVGYSSGSRYIDYSYNCFVGVSEIAGFGIAALELVISQNHTPKETFYSIKPVLTLTTSYAAFLRLGIGAFIPLRSEREFPLVLFQAGFGI